MLAAAIPTAGFAVEALREAPAKTAVATASFTPASADPRVARLVARADGGERLMRFTPAGAATRSGPSVTVAVRVDESAARVISIRSAVEAAQAQVAGIAPLRITPARYNLGLARGYESFVKAPVAAPLSRTLSDAAIPDLAAYRPTPGVAETPSRFAARIAADESVAAPRINDTREQSVDVGGSYRLTRNLDVTAGVRYSQDRDRLAPVADTAKQDNQAVYVGTQFRF